MRASCHRDWSNTREQHEEHRPPIVRTHRSDGRPDEVLRQPRLEQRKTDHLRHARYRESGDGAMLPGEVRASRHRYWSTPPKGNIRNTSRRESGHGANFADGMSFSYHRDWSNTPRKPKGNMHQGARGGHSGGRPNACLRPPRLQQHTRNLWGERVLESPDMAQSRSAG